MCKGLSELREFYSKFSSEDCIFMQEHEDASFQKVQNANIDNREHIWLPTESQLHSLINFEYSDSHPYFYFVRNSYHASERDMPFNLFSSFEQYALAFLMKSAYSKVWCKNEWILI